MNEKFFDIKKEKQDRILNALFKAFAQNGYKKASTDDMVKEAGISKGLLFYYFVSKAGMYEFACRYGARYMSMELGSFVSGRETDYFLLMKQVEEAKFKLMSNFPYMPLFMQQLMVEQDGLEAETAEEVRRIRQNYRELLEGLFKKADFSRYREEAAGTAEKQRKLCALVEYVKDGVMREVYGGGETPRAEEAYEKTVSCLDMLYMLCR